MQQINSSRDMELQTACILQHVTNVTDVTQHPCLYPQPILSSAQSPEADHRVRLVYVWREPAEGVSPDVSRENGN